MVGICITEKPWHLGLSRKASGKNLAAPYSFSPSMPSEAIGTFYSRWTAAAAARSIPKAIKADFKVVERTEIYVPAPITDAERRLIIPFITHDLIHRCKDIINKSKDLANLNVRSACAGLLSTLKLDLGLVDVLVSVFGFMALDFAASLKVDGKSKNKSQARDLKCLEHFDAFEMLHKKKTNLPLARKALEREICDPSSGDVEVQQVVLETLKKLSARTGRKRAISGIPRGPVAWRVYDCGDVMVPNVLPGGCMFVVVGSYANGAEEDAGMDSRASLLDVNVCAIVLEGQIKEIHEEFCHQPNNPSTPTCGAASFLVQRCFPCHVATARAPRLWNL